MKNIIIALFSVFLSINCGSPAKGTEQKENDSNTENNAISISDNRELLHLLVISYPEYGAVKTELQAFYSDGSIINYKGNLEQSSISEINKMMPDKAHYKEVNGNLVCYSNEKEFTTVRDLQKRAETITTDNSWKKYEWAMIGGKWLIRPIGMQMDPDFKRIPDPNAQELVFVLLDGYCSYENIEINTDGWYQLSYLPNRKQFEVAPANLNIKQFYWDCGDMNMYTVTSDIANSVLLFKGLEVNTGIVNSHFHKVTCVVPGNDYIFSFNGKSYNLRAEGILDVHHDSVEEDYPLSEEGRKETGNVYQEYKLYLECEGISQLMLAIDNFRDRYVKIGFIGDLDGDGNPDFIFETATWYEDYEKMLFLSSFADEGKLVKYVGSNGYSMAC